MKQPNLGKKILELRLAKGLTQGELAEKCNLSLRTIQRIELSEVTPRSYTVKLIFSSLECDVYNSFAEFPTKTDKSVYGINNWLEQFYRYVL
ncbi:MAG: helix-turn-helix transcriptional regulator [Breznakibacter sp.]